MRWHVCPVSVLCLRLARCSHRRGTSVRLPAHRGVATGVGIEDGVDLVKTTVKFARDSHEYFFAEGCFITEWSNSPDDPEVSVARARVEPGKTTRWHYLRNTSERYVVLSGNGQVEVGDLPAQRVAAGDVVVIAPGVRQRITNPGAADLVFLAICSPRFSEAAYVQSDD
ncbi:MAG: cupin domain-containing protein [Halioglobus sp.]|nr:cupin domain-containing protein [Halioglobus sp.]